MFKTTSRICYFLLSLIITTATAQEAEDEQINQAVFNKIEYHFNLQETDSIYALAGDKFRQSLSSEAFRSVMSQQLYPLGRIQSAELISFEKGTGVYKLNFISTPLKLVLGLDSGKKIETFLFQPYSDTAPDKTAPVASTNTAV